MSIERIARKVACLCPVLLACVLAGAEVHAKSFLLSGTWGGPGGAEFVDSQSLAGEVSAILVRSGSMINSVQVVYRVRGKQVAGPRHGGNGGRIGRFDLRRGEHIIEIGGRSGKYVDSLYVRTNERTQRWGGPGGQFPYRYRVPRGSRLTGIWGRSGNLLDAIGVVVTYNAQAAPSRHARRNVENHLKKAFAKISSGGSDDGKADQPMKLLSPSLSLDRSWAANEDAGLLVILSRLFNSPEALGQYRGLERKECRGSVACQITARRLMITETLGF